MTEHEEKNADSDSPLERLVMTLESVGIPVTIRAAAGDELYQYLFIGNPEDASYIHAMDDNFETTRLDELLRRHKYFEFENGQLASWSAS